MNTLYDAAQLCFKLEDCTVVWYKTLKYWLKVPQKGLFSRVILRNQKEPQNAPEELRGTIITSDASLILFETYVPFNN